MMNTAKKHFRPRLISCAIASILLNTSYSWASDSADTEQRTQLVDDVVVVVGYKTATRQAIEVKRASDGIVDAISQDDIGLLPDLTISDLARRIPGVTTISQSGPEGTRSVNSEQNVVIRGLEPNFNLTTFDGVPIASTSEDDRAANLSIVPPTVVKRVEAVKTLSADLNPHALSGQLNLVTRSAFDRNETYLSVRATGGQNSTAGEGIEEASPQLRSSITYATPYGEDNEFGIVMSASYESFNSSTFDLRPGASSSTYLFYEADETSDDTTDFYEDSNGYPAARRNQMYLFDVAKDRASGSVKLEYSPNDDVYASLFAAFFYQDEEETRYEHLEAGDDGIRPIDQTLYTGTYSEAEVQQGYVYQPEESLTKALTARYEAILDNDAAFDVVASVSKSDVDKLRNMSKFAPIAGYSTDTGYSYDLSSGQPVATYFNPDIVNDTTLSENDYIRERTQTIAQLLKYFSASYADNTQKSDVGFGYELGVNFTSREQKFDREYIEGDVFNTTDCIEEDISDCPLVNLSDYVLDKTLPGYDPNINFYFIDDAALRADWIAQGKTITNDRTDNSIRDDYALEEDIFATYLKLSYRTDDFNIVGGLRYDDTEATADIYYRDDTLDDDPDDAAQYLPLSRTNSYNFLLPSVIANYELAENFILRAGYGKTIGRPDFSDIALQERVREPDYIDETDLSLGGTIEITRSNPDLLPMVSDNFDLSSEYYFDQGASLVSAAVFYKDVQDLIYTQTTIDSDYDHNGYTLEAEIEQPVNADDSSIYGFEFTTSKDFENDLPAPFNGLSVETNLTWIGSQFTFINAEGDKRELDGWVNQPQFLANLQLAYESGPFTSKLGINYVGSFLSKILADEGNIYDMYRDKRMVIDFQTRYSVSDELTLVAQVKNLTEEGVTYHRKFQDAGKLLAAEVERGRTFWLGLKWKPDMN